MSLSLLAILIAAFLYAKLEVHTEGQDGWAKNLPTWRIEKHWLLTVFLGGRALTGYHVWAFSFVFFMFHFPFVWMQRWSWPLEGQALASILLFWVAEDFIWFVINPHYGWHRYREQKIVWHPRWFCGIPADHWGMLLISFLLFAWSHGRI